MLFDDYAAKALLCNVSLSGTSSTHKISVYRGDLVIEEGDIADAQGRRNPPKSVIKQSVCLAVDDKLKMVAGAIEEIDSVPAFVEKYQQDLSEDAKFLFYVYDIGKELIVNIQGIHCILIPHEEGSVWTMLLDEFRLDKDDFKGQKSEDKVVTIYNAFLEFNPKYDLTNFEQAQEYKVEVKKQARGAV